MHASRLLPFGVALALACAGAPAPAPEPCEWSAQGRIALSRPEPTDVATASVFGSRCADASVTLRILDAERRAIYHFEAPLAVFLTPGSDASSLSEDAPAEARRLVEALVRAQPLRTVQDLPPWAAGEIDDGIGFHQHLLPREELARLADQPVFQHQAGWQQRYELAFDPRAGQVVRVLESWR